ncbi:MAG: alpha/beta hydrolase, partial [bacterium]
MNPVSELVIIHGTESSGEETKKLLEANVGREILARYRCLYPSFRTPYQFLSPAADRQMLEILNRNHISRACMLGFSGGAQFAHRFTLMHPEIIVLAVCLSAGCWTSPAGKSYGMMVEEGWFDKEPWSGTEVTMALSRKAPHGPRNTKWIIGCGSLDKASRISSAKRFFSEIASGASDYFE